MYKSIAIDLLATDLALAIPAVADALEAWLHGIVESSDDFGVKVYASVLGKSVRASASFRCVSHESLVAARAEAKREYAGCLAVLFGLLDDSLAIADTAICKHEDALLLGRGIVLAGLGCSQGLENVCAAEVSVKPCDLFDSFVLGLIIVDRDFIALGAEFAAEADYGERAPFW